MKTANMNEEHKPICTGLPARASEMMVCIVDEPTDAEEVGETKVRPFSVAAGAFVHDIGQMNRDACEWHPMSSHEERIQGVVDDQVSTLQYAASTVAQDEQHAREDMVQREIEVRKRQAREVAMREMEEAAVAEEVAEKERLEAEAARREADREAKEADEAEARAKRAHSHADLVESEAKVLKKELDKARRARDIARVEHMENMYLAKRAELKKARTKADQAVLDAERERKEAREARTQADVERLQAEAASAQAAQEKREAEEAVSKLTHVQELSAPGPRELLTHEIAILHTVHKFGAQVDLHTFTKRMDEECQDEDVDWVEVAFDMIPLEKGRDRCELLEEVVGAFQDVCQVPRKTGLKETIQRLEVTADKYRAAGNAAEALPLLRRSLKLSSDLMGPRSPEVGRTALMMARCFVSVGQHHEALPLLESSLQIREAHYGAQSHAAAARPGLPSPYLRGPWPSPRRGALAPGITLWPSTTWLA